jgi:Tol biopolymer transport system component
MMCLLLACFGDAVCSPGGEKAPQPTQVTVGPVGEIGPRCSPDGRRLAFESVSLDHPETIQLWIMPVNGTFSSATLVLGYQKGQNYGEFSWSPDSSWLSFIEGTEGGDRVISDQVSKVNPSSKRIVRLTNLPPRTALGGTSWSRDGRILFEMNDAFYVVNGTGAGSGIEKLIDIGAELHAAPLFPAWSADGTRVAFTSGQVLPSKGGRALYVWGIRSGKITKLFEGVGDDAPSWLDDDSILCSHIDDEAHSSIWLVHVSKGTATQVTRGFFDVSPAACPPGGNLYFARAANRSSARYFLEGFHIWKLNIGR